MGLASVRPEFFLTKSNPLRVEPLTATGCVTRLNPNSDSDCAAAA